MKTLKWSLLIVLVTGLGVSTIMRLARSPHPLDMDANQATDANERNQAIDRDEAVVYQPAPLTTVPVRKLASVAPPTPDKTTVPAAGVVSEPQGVTWSSVTPAQLEFEQRLTAALMLQQNLVAQEVKVKPSPDAATQASYEGALRQLLVRLKSSANIGT